MEKGAVIKVKTFGKFTLELEGEVFNVREFLGKQLTDIFALLIYNEGYVVSKETLYDIFWQENKNPESAKKYAIFRLLAELSKIKEIEWINTTKSGYILNPELKYEMDFKVIDNLSKKKNSTLEDYNTIISIYKEKFLLEVENDWIFPIRDYYSGLYATSIKNVASLLIDEKKYDQALSYCEKGLMLDTYNEDIIYLYCKTMITAKRYNKALNYFDMISKNMYKELGVQIQERIRNLFAGVNESEEQSINVDKMTLGLKMEEDFHTPLFCDYFTFKKLYQIKAKTAYRENRIVNLVFLEIKSNESELNDIMNELENIIVSSIRLNDIFTRVSSNQFILLLDLKQLEDSYVVIDRIQKKFYKKESSKKVKLHYYVRNVNDANYMNSLQDSSARNRNN